MKSNLCYLFAKFNKFMDMNGLYVSPIGSDFKFNCLIYIIVDGFFFIFNRNWPQYFLKTTNQKLMV